MASFPEAAYIVLKKARKPLNIAEITNKALSEGILVTQGKTPVRTMSASLYLENKRKFQRGRKTRFEFLGNNMWGLSA
ncbi:winged helix-turn-helix domain-containing protein [Chloroflexota bacterium]